MADQAAVRALPAPVRCCGRPWQSRICRRNGVRGASGRSAGLGRPGMKISSSMPPKRLRRSRNLHPGGASQPSAGSASSATKQSVVPWRPRYLVKAAGKPRLSGRDRPDGRQATPVNHLQQNLFPAKINHEGGCRRPGHPAGCRNEKGSSGQKGIVLASFVPAGVFLLLPITC